MPTSEKPTSPEEGGPELILGESPSATEWLTIPISGTGPAGGSVLVTTPARGTFATDIGADGAFCIDVPLEPATTNRLVFQAVDVEGRYSEEVVREVTQQGEPPEAPAGEEPRNVMLGAPLARMTVSVESGELYSLVDGNHTSFVRLSNDTFADDWLALQLAERASIERIRVTSTGQCPLSECVVMVSDLEDPGDAVKGSPDWMVIEHVVGGTTVEEFEFDPTAARWIALQFLSKDCGAWYETDKHEIREIEAWTPAAPAPPAPEGPSCQSGGL